MSTDGGRPVLLHSANVARAHRDPDFLAAKLARLRDPHVAPLQDLARSIGERSGEEVPWFDPDSGGVRSRVLLLLEAPGRRAMPRDGLLAARGGSGMVSLDNDDPTAEALWQIQREAGLRREESLIWNIVPWYVGSAGSIRPVDGEDLRRARPFLDELLALLPDLQVVVAIGEKARRGWFEHLLGDRARLLPTLVAPHPSPQVLRITPHRRAEITAALRRAHEHVDRARRT